MNFTRVLPSLQWRSTGSALLFAAALGLTQRTSATPFWDITGEWNLQYTVANFTTDLQMRIDTQDPTTGVLSGVALNTPLGVSAGNPITGQVDGNAVFLQGSMSDGQSIQFTGLIVPPGEMAGTVAWNNLRGIWHGGFSTLSGQARPLPSPVPDNTSSSVHMLALSSAVLVAFNTLRKKSGPR